MADSLRSDSPEGKNVLTEFVPLFQTFSWIALICFAMHIFRKQLYRIIEALTCRIEQGGSIKGPGFEIGSAAPHGKNETPAADIVIEKAIKALPSNESKDTKLELAKQIRSAYIRIDSHPLLQDDGHIWDEYIDDNLQVYTFLNRIWFEMRGLIKPFRYGKDWLIRNKTTGDIYPLLGSAWAKLHGFDDDTRLLSEIGIVGGMEIEVITPSRSLKFRQ
jgi:hypothetical protein